MQPALRESPQTRLLLNSILLVSTYVLSRIVLFISTVYLGRTMGASIFGDLNFSYALFLYATLFSNLGLMIMGTRQVAQRPLGTQPTVAAIVSLRLILAAVSALVLITVALFLPTTGNGRIILILFSLALVPNAVTIDWFFKGHDRMGVVANIEILKAVPYLILILIFVRDPSQGLLVPVLFLFGIIAAAAYSFWVYGDRALPFVADPGVWLRYLRESWALGIGFFFVQIYYISDLVLVGLLTGSSATGLYSSAHRTLGFVQGMGGWYLEAMFPSLARSQSDSAIQPFSLTKRSLQLTFSLGIPLIVCGTVYPEAIITLLYGQDYAGAAGAFRILVWAIGIGLVGMNFGYLLLAQNRGKVYLTVVAIGALISIAVGTAGIGYYGLAAAGFGRLLSEIAIAVGFWMGVRSQVGISWLAFALKPLVAALGLLAVMAIVPSTFLLKTVAGAVAYIALMLLLSPRERQAFWGSAREMLSVR